MATMKKAPMKKGAAPKKMRKAPMQAPSQITPAGPPAGAPPMMKKGGKMKKGKC